MEIRTEVWERVMAFASLLANESRRDRYWAHYNALRDYCDALARDGYDHPFLWETLADFTPDDGAAIPLYLKALQLSVGDAARHYRVSIRFALAARYKNRGHGDAARKYALAAYDEAKEIDDMDLRRSISRFLLS
jgi:hypothetical protein